MKAVIMAGGEGTRLRPLTCGMPKPMVPVMNKPVMEYTIELLGKHGIKDIAVTLAYLPTVITDYFESGEKWGVNLRYYIEEVPLGTGGSVKNAQEFLDDTFIVISGDALTDLDIQKAIEFHKNKQSKATLVLKRESIPLEYGVIITDDDGRIIRFLEKPSWGEVFSDTINTGIYVLEPEVLDYYKKGDNFDFSKDLFPKLLKDGVPMYGYVTEDYWCDIGDLNSYRQTHFDILDGKVNIDFKCKQVEKGIWVDEDTVMEEGVTIEPPVYIGEGCIVKRGCHIAPYTVVGANCEIGERTSLKKTIIWKNVRIGKDSQCRGTVICGNVNIKNKVHLYENSVIGSESILLSGVIVKPDIKIWPGKKLEENTVLSQHLIWGTKGSKTLFGNRDISGDINIDITPEFATRVGSAFATILEDDANVVLSCDGSNASQLVKDSIACGILSTGVGVVDIKDATIPMNRFAIRHYRAEGGIHVRMDNLEPNRVHIEFYNDKGANIDRGTERKIENLFNRDDFERCNSDSTRRAVKIDNFHSLYINSGITLLNNKSEIKRRNLGLIIGSRSENVMEIATQFLNNIGCQAQRDFLGSQYNSIEEYATYMSWQVQKNRLDMGIILDESGENLVLIDKLGRIIDRERYTALVSLILLKMRADNRLVVPYTAPNVIEKMAKTYKAKVVRTKSSPSYIMGEMLDKQEGDQGWPLQYIMHFDAVWAAAKIIDFLIEKKIRLEQLVDEMPDFYYKKKEVECDWRDKGRVIRDIIVENKDKDIELFEGVKVYSDKGWALVIPDSERPVFKVYTEGHSEEYAEELSTFFSEKVKQLLKNQRR